MKEIWRDIDGFEGMYQISNYGRVRSILRTVISKNGIVKHLKSVILNPGCYTSGYLFVALCKNGKVYQHSIHRLVANAFIPNPEHKPEVNHIDLNKKNNSVINLEWVTGTENQLHTVCMGGKSQSKQVLCLETGIIYDSMARADAAIGCSEGFVSKSIRKGIGCKGFHFKEIK